jgi:hypothetical protein
VFAALTPTYAQVVLDPIIYNPRGYVQHPASSFSPTAKLILYSSTPDARSDNRHKPGEVHEVHERQEEKANG